MKGFRAALRFLQDTDSCGDTRWRAFFPHPPVRRHPAIGLRACNRDGSASADSSLVAHVGGSLPLDAQRALAGDPRFVDAINGDFHLRDNSPFINLGLAPIPAYAFDAIDLDGSLRTRFGAADPGAYENQTWDFLLADGFEH